MQKVSDSEARAAINDSVDLAPCDEQIGTCRILRNTEMAECFLPPNLPRPAVHDVKSQNTLVNPAN